MTRIALAALLALALLSTPAWADEEKVEALFHEAYVQEVVYGQVEIAATQYLEIAEAEGASPRLRAEARFRFAICTTLLGRADEARVWLGELVEDESAPAAVRKRAASYLESLSSVPVGSQLEQKLQELVFQLGRAQASQQTVPEYRDFEILGERAVPFLKQLLHHEDPTIRQHAFRILCRMGVDGMGSAWHGGIPFAGAQFTYDVVRYLQVPGRDVDREALESSLLALDDEKLGSVLGSMRRGNLDFSLDFARAVAVRRKLTGVALAFLDAPDEATETWAQVKTWLEGEDEELAQAAVKWIAGQSKAPPAPYAVSLFPALWRGVLTQPTRTFGSSLPIVYAQPASALVDALDAVLVAEASWEGHPNQSPLRRGLAHLITAVLAGRPPEEVDLQRLDDIVRRRMTAEIAWITRPQQRAGGHYAIQNDTWSLVTYLLKHQPSEDGQALVRWILRHPLSEHRQDRPLLGRYVPVERPEHVPVLMAAMQEVGGGPPHSYWSFFTSQLSRRDMPSETRAALFRSLPEWLSFLDADHFAMAVSWMPSAAEFLPEEEAVEAVARLLVKLPEGPPAWRRRITEALSTKRVGNSTLVAPTFAAAALFPAADRVWAKLPDDVRTVLLDRASRFLTQEARGELIIAEGREAIASFLLAHLDDIGDDVSIWAGLAAASDLIPLETWIPRSPYMSTSYLKSVPSERREAAARKLVENPGVPKRVVLGFLRDRAPREIAKDYFDELLVSGDPERYVPAIDEVDYNYGSPASYAALEAALASLLAQEKVDLVRVSKVARILVQRQPSAKLFPAARALMISEDRTHVQNGIDLAFKLGQPDLIPALVPHVGSMDQDVRKAAKRAIDSIREIEALQAGVR